MTAGGKLKTVRATVLKCNSNHTTSGYIYPKDVVKKALEEECIKERLVQGILFGSLEYDASDLSVEKVAFVVERFYWRKDELKAIISILDTPRGREICGILDKVRFDACGIGTVTPERTVEDYGITGILAHIKTERKNK